MKPLIPQTVYVPSKSFHGAAYEVMCSYELVEPCVNKEKLYTFTKEELIELLGLAYDAVMSRKMGYDHEGFPRGVGFTKEQFVNNLINQK